MNFSLLYLPTWRHGFGISLQDYLSELTEAVVLADGFGWTRALTTEHHFHYYGGAVPNPAVILSNWASTTDNIRLGACVSLMQLRNPLNVAEDYALLDQLSGGRCDFGIARGFVPHEFEAFNIKPSNVTELISEGLEICKRFWAGETFSYTGKHFAFKELEAWPSAVNGNLPIWNAASNSKESFISAAEQGYHLMMNQYPMSFDSLKEKFTIYCSRWENSGRKASDRKAMVNFMTHIAPSEKQAINEAKGPLQEHAGAFAKLLKGYQWDKKYESDVSVLLNMSEINDLNDMFRRRTLICSPQQAVERLKKYIEIGFTEIAFMPRFGSLTHEQNLATMHLLNEEVIPLL